VERSRGVLLILVWFVVSVIVSMGPTRRLSWADAARGGVAEAPEPGDPGSG
jgi:hypothetical protein